MVTNIFLFDEVFIVITVFLFQLKEQFLDSELQINTPFSGIEHLRLPIEMLCQMEKSTNKDLFEFFLFSTNQSIQGTELSKSLQNLRKLGFDAMMNYMEEDKEQDAEVGIKIITIHQKYY